MRQRHELNFENLYMAVGLALLASLLAAWAEFGAERADVLVVRAVSIIAFLLAIVSIGVPEWRELLNGILFAGFLLIAFLGGVPGVQLSRANGFLYRKAAYVFLTGGVITAIACFTAVRGFGA